MKKIWSFLINEAKEMTRFEIEFDNRNIVIHWKFPFFGGDGKAFLAMLGLLAVYCFYCTLTQDECQNTSRVMKGFTINRKVSDLRAHYQFLKMKSIVSKAKKGEKFIDKFSHQERQGLCVTPIALDDGRVQEVPSLTHSSS